LAASQYARYRPAVVFPDNKLQVGLGISFLSRLSQFEIAAGRLILKR